MALNHPSPTRVQLRPFQDQAFSVSHPDDMRPLTSAFPNSRRAHEGEGCANHGAKCAVRPRCWDLEVSGALFGVSLGRFGRCGRAGARRCDARAR